MALMSRELTAQLEERIGQAAGVLQSQRDEIARLSAERDRLVEEQLALRGRVSELEEAVGRLRHLEQESASILERHHALTERVEGLLSLLQGQNQGA